MTQYNSRQFVFKDFTGCSNHSCVVIGKRKGMGTNGPCHCLIDASRHQLNMLSQRLQAHFQELEASPDTVTKAEYDALVADKERLDWFQKKKPTVRHYITSGGLFFGVDISTDDNDIVAKDKNIRQAIDSAKGK